MAAHAAAAMHWWVPGVLVVCMLWGLLLRSGQRSLSEARGLALPGASEALTAYLIDPSLITYFLLPVYLAVVATSLTSSADYPVLARTRTSARFLWWDARSGLPVTVVLIAAWLLAGAVTTVGLPLTSGPISAQGVEHSALLEAVADQPGGRATPASAYAAAQVLLLGCALMALRMLLSLVFLLTRTLGVLMVTGAAVWVGTVLSWKLPLESIVGPIDAMVLHEAGQYLPWWVTAAIPAAATGVLLGVAWGVDRAVVPMRTGVSAPLARWGAAMARRPGVIYGVVVVLSVVAFTTVTVAFATSPWDVFLATAWGTSPEGASGVGYSLFTVIFVGFAYLVSAQLDTELGDRLPYVMIRHRSMRRWTLRQLARFTGQSVVLVAGVFALAAGLGHLLVDVPANSGPAGVMTSSGALITMSATTVFQFAANGVLQLLAYSTALFLLLWWTRSSVWALGALAAIVLLSLPGANLDGWIPVGLNSVGMLTTASAIRMTVELLVVDVVLIVAALWSVTRSGTTTTERS